MGGIGSKLGGNGCDTVTTSVDVVENFRKAHHDALQRLWSEVQRMGGSGRPSYSAVEWNAGGPRQVKTRSEPDGYWRVLNVVEEFVSNLTGSKTCLPAFREHVTPLARAEDSRLESRMEELRQQYEAAIKQKQDELEAAIKQKQVEHEAATSQLLRESSARMSDLQNLNGTLMQQKEHLREQIGKLEVEGSRNCGSYLDCSATPNDVQLQAERIKNSLASFSKAVMYGDGNVLKDVDGAVDSGLSPPTGEINFARRSDVKFWYQKHGSEIVFFGFEADDFQIPECCSVEMDLKKRRSDSYREYKELASLMAQSSDVWMKRFEEPATCFCQPSGCCTCGGYSFLTFCHIKSQQMLQSRIGNFWSKLHARDTVDTEEDIAVKKKLLHLVTDVWLCHLLASSFDPPCTIFKVKVGSVFDAAYMENVIIRDDENETASYKSDSVWRVAFMVVPGFRIGKSVVRAKVYLH